MYIYILCMYMCVCIYIYIYIHRYTHTYVYVCYLRQYVHVALPTSMAKVMVSAALDTKVVAYYKKTLTKQLINDKR